MKLSCGTKGAVITTLGMNVVMAGRSDLMMRLIGVIGQFRLPGSGLPVPRYVKSGQMTIVTVAYNPTNLEDVVDRCIVWCNNNGVTLGEEGPCEAAKRLIKSRIQNHQKQATEATRVRPPRRVRRGNNPSNVTTISIRPMVSGHWP